MSVSQLLRCRFAARGYWSTLSAHQQVPSSLRLLANGTLAWSRVRNCLFRTGPGSTSSQSSNFDSMAHRLKSMRFRFLRADPQSPPPLGQGIRRLLSVIQTLGEKTSQGSDAELDRIAIKLEEDLVECFRREYSHESQFEERIMAAFHSLGKQRDSNSICISEDLELRTQLKVGEVAGGVWSKPGFGITDQSRCDVSLVLVDTGGHPTAVLASVELKRGESAPPLLSAGSALMWKDLTRKGLGSVSQQTGHSLKTTAPSHRMVLGWCEPFVTAVVGCKSSGANGIVGALGLRISPPPSFGDEWTGQVVASVHGSSDTDIAAAAAVFVDVFTSAVSRYATESQRELRVKCPMLGPLPGTKLLMSPFLPASAGSISQGELLQIVDHAEARGAIAALPRRKVRGFGCLEDMAGCEFVKISCADSLIGWMNTDDHCTLALERAQEDPTIRLELRKVVKYAASVRGFFLMAMPDLSTTTKKVTYDMLIQLWDMFCDNIVFGMLIPMLENGVIYSDLRTARSNVRWMPDCSDATSGAFLLWDLDSLMLAVGAPITRLPQFDGRFPPYDDSMPQNFVFAQVVLVAFCTELRLEESELMAGIEQREAPGVSLWDPEANPTALSQKFEDWSLRQEELGCAGLREAVRDVRNGHPLKAFDLLRCFVFTPTRG
mmetsp:Transcript_16746/g.40074  ORF Transcript_16746/g.40074 Transcript_16746/m.40074 type:complete len:662 (-) Transcript_16746:129-2114(-)